MEAPVNHQDSAPYLDFLGNEAWPNELKKLTLQNVTVKDLLVYRLVSTSWWNSDSLENEFYCRILTLPKLSDYLGSLDGQFYRFFTRGGLNLVKNVIGFENYELSGQRLKWINYLRNNIIDSNLDLGIHYAEINKEDIIEELGDEYILFKSFMKSTLQFDCPYLRTPAKYLEDEKIYLIFDNQIEAFIPYVVNMPLEEYNEKFVIELVRQLIHAMKFLHQRQFCLINERGGVDLGIKKTVYGEAQLQLTGYTYCLGDDSPSGFYFSPEGINEPEVQKLTSDLFALGSMTYYLLKGSLPFDIQPKRILFKIGKFKNFKSYKDLDHGQKELSKEALKFIFKLLQRNPNDRMTLDEALEHPWLTNPSPKTSPLCTAHENFVREYTEKMEEEDFSSGSSDSDSDSDSDDSSSSDSLW